jgi:AcrR family transcriptional regulator
MPRIAADVRAERRRHLVAAAWRSTQQTPFGELTVDAVCAAAGVSKGTFYGYFTSKDELLLALLEDETAALDRILEELDSSTLSGMARVRRFAQALLELGEEPARAAVRADIWVALRKDALVRERFHAASTRRRAVLRGWIETSVAAGEVLPVPANATAAILVALTDGLLLYASLDPTAFQWANVRRALEMLLQGLGQAPPPEPARGEQDTSSPDDSKERQR